MSIMKMTESARTVFEKLLYEGMSCTLATASLDGVPEAATIGYAADEKYGLYFQTFSHYTKYKNLEKNPCGSIVITNKLTSVQMDGKTDELKGEKKERARKMLLAKYGDEMECYLDSPSAVFFKFTPHWIRLLKDDTYPPTYEMVE